MLRGFGKIVEFDESFFAGAPKYGRGRAKGWKDEDEWVFGLVERGTLNCWLEQVDKSRSRKCFLRSSMNVAKMVQFSAQIPGVHTTN